MNKTYDLLITDAVENIQKIDDPLSRVEAIAKIIPYVDREIILSSDTEGKDAAKRAEKPAAKAETKKAEKKETKAKDTPKEHKPLTMVKPTSEDVAKVAEAMKEEEILPPSENDTPEMAEKRRTQVIKKYGDMPISQAFSDEKICELLSDELESMNALREQIRECFGIVVTEDENGEVSETSESGITSEQVEKLLSFYIHEADENADDCGSVTLDKFLTKFIPYMVTLYQIYQYDGNQISAAGAEMTNKDSFGAANININNAEALLCVLKELNKAA